MGIKEETEGWYCVRLGQVSYVLGISNPYQKPAAHVLDLT